MTASSLRDGSGAAVRREPALRFWLSYAEREGALVEDGVDHALVVLPDRLRDAAGLEEECVVTAEPDVAREEGAVLLIPGHPALEQAADAVLEGGDVGRGHLPWPTSLPPSAPALEQHLRERLHVEHGRIDVTGEPARAYLPLLRVGAAITYLASLSYRLQEREEVWVDARTGLAVQPAVLSTIAGRPRLAGPDARHRALPADLPRALTCAHAILEERATARRAKLVAHTRRARDAELARAASYFEGALESIARRRASAPAERRHLLDNQEEATRAERARRSREIEEEFTARHEIRPFRLHLVLVPALVVPCEVRRGPRRFPFAAAWLLTASTFADVRCPHCCDAPAELVAGRERLGCRACL